MEFIIITHDEKIWDISELVTSVSYNDRLNDGCSKLEFSYVDDNLNIENGNGVRFTYDKFVFVGYVFKFSHNRKNEITVTAYDQLRYAKAKDSIVIQKDTVSTLVNRMCAYMKFTKGSIIDTKYYLKTDIADEKTWLDIIYSAISETLTNKGKWYCLRDEAGSVCLRDLEDLTLNLIIGDESLCYDYEYEKSIDEDFYNLIKLQVPGKPEDARDNKTVIVKDDKSMAKFGVLQYYELLDENTNVSRASAKADTLLKLYNHETEILSLRCLGDVSVRAGNSFYGSIEDIKLNKLLTIRSVTHNFLPVHTMAIEITI